VARLKIELADSIDKNDHYPKVHLHKKGSDLPYPMKGVRLRQGFYSINQHGDVTNWQNQEREFTHWMVD